jgi:hypothetical protein
MRHAETIRVKTARAAVRRQRTTFNFRRGRAREIWKLPAGDGNATAIRSRGDLADCCPLSRIFNDAPSRRRRPAVRPVAGIGCRTA